MFPIYNKSSLILEGIVFVILGIFAIALPTITTISITILVGILFLIAGLIQLIRVFQHQDSNTFWISLINAALAIVVGILILVYPLHGAMFLTLMLGIWFLFHGIIQIALSFQAKEVSENWWLLLFSGIVSVLLSLIIWSGWPATSLWIIGLLLGINLLFFGISLLTIAFRIKHIERQE